MKTQKVLQRAMLFLLPLCAIDAPVNAQTTDSLSIETNFIPAGYMGCIANLTLNDAWRENPHSGPICFKVTYTTTCPKITWAGIYWTNTADDNGANWGQYPGLDLSGRNFTRVTFWAKGDRGGELVKFGTFGIDNTSKQPVPGQPPYRYKDVCGKIEQTVVLTTIWRKYTLDLRSCQNMSSVIGGFYFSASYLSNPTGLVFYMDDMQFEH